MEAFFDECLYKLLMLEYNRIYGSEGIDVNKTIGSRECIIYHNCYFLEINFMIVAMILGWLLSVLMMLQFFLLKEMIIEFIFCI